MCYYILRVLCNLLVSSGWYFLISAIFFAIFPSLLLIFATLSEISKMSRILSDLGGSPRNLLNFLIKPGIFFPSTLVAKEKTYCTFKALQGFKKTRSIKNLDSFVKSLNWLPKSHICLFHSKLYLYVGNTLIVFYHFHRLYFFMYRDL